jgi:hypothetical protein
MQRAGTSVTDTLRLPRQAVEEKMKDNQSPSQRDPATTRKMYAEEQLRGLYGTDDEVVNLGACFSIFSKI